MSSNGFADAQGPGEDVFSRARALKTKPDEQFDDPRAGCWVGWENPMVCLNRVRGSHDPDDHCEDAGLRDGIGCHI